MSWNMRVKQDQNIISHHGILGMKWGVRRTPEQLGHLRSSARISKSGAIRLEKGASLTRVINSKNGVFRGDLAYASILEYDAARYISLSATGKIGNLDIDKIVHIRAKEPLVAPSQEEATRTLGKLMAEDKEVRSFMEKVYERKITDAEIDKIINKPSSMSSKYFYIAYNTLFTIPDTASIEYLGAKISGTQTKYINALKKQGYNMLRDENDFGSGATKSPVIIFNPEQSLDIVSIDDITSDIIRQSKDTVKTYERLGRKWMDEYVYS